MKTTTYRAGAAAVLAALTLSACGGTTVKAADGTSTTTSATTTESTTSSSTQPSTSSETTSESSTETTSESSTESSTESSSESSAASDGKDNGATDNKRTVPNYYVALSKNDPESACGTMAGKDGEPFFKDPVKFNACAGSIRKNLSSMSASTRSAMALVSDSEVHSTGATTAYAYPIALGKTQTSAKFGLVQSGGKWYINSAGTTSSAG